MNMTHVEGLRIYSILIMERDKSTFWPIVSKHLWIGYFYIDQPVHSNLLDCSMLGFRYTLARIKI